MMDEGIMQHQVKITEVRIKKSFLKIFVQNIKCPNFQKIQCLEYVYKTLQSGGDVGDLCMVKTEGVVHRCRVIDIIDNEKATLYFIDSGFTASFPVNLLRFIPETNFFYSLLPLCKPFYIAGIMIDTNVHNYRDKIKNKINSLLHNKIVGLKIAGEIPPLSLAHIEIKGTCFVNDFILSDPICAEIFRPCSVSDQLNQLSNFEEPRLYREILPESPDENKMSRPAKRMYAVGSGEHDVKILECKDGPKNFYVEFVSTEKIKKYKAHEELLREAALSPLAGSTPSIGTKVITLVNNNNLKRLDALRGIVKSVDNQQVKVHLVDKGREIIARLSNVYSTTDKINDVLPFAVQFSLKDVESATQLDEEEMKFYFRYLTHNRNLKLTVLSSSRSDIQLCSLKDTADDVLILNLLKAYDPRSLTYPKQFILKPGNYKVEISAIESANNFYVTLIEKESCVAYYEKQLESLNACELKCPSPGNVCSVKIQDKFHRGKFLKRISPLLSEVQLIDYGTIYKVNHKDVGVIVEKILKHPPAAYLCCLNESEDYFRTKSLSKLYGKEININIQSYENGVYNVVILDSAEKSQGPISKNNGWDELDSEWSITQDENIDFCRISHVLNVNDFTIQLIANMPQLQTMVNQWQYFVKKIGLTGLTEVSRAKENDVYVVQDPEIKMWIRVVLLKTEKINNKEVQTLRNIDDGSILKRENLIFKDVFEVYDREKHMKVGAVLIDVEKNGNKEVKLLKNIDDGSIIKVDDIEWAKVKKRTEWVDSSIKLFEAPVDIRVPFPSGIRCRLSCIVNTNHEQEASEFLMNLCGKQLTYKILDCEPQYNTIHLFDGENNVLNELVKLKYVEKLQILSTGCAFITYIYHLKEFYIQQIETSSTLNIIRLFASRQYKRVPVEEPKIDQLVMAKYKLDGLWYRAIISRIVDANINVKFIDYGNTEVVNLKDIGALNDQWVIDTPHLAAKCALDLPDDLDPNSSNAVDFLKFFADNGLKSFNYKLIRSAEEYSVIKIFEAEKNKDILEDIVLLCKPSIKSVEPPPEIKLTETIEVSDIYKSTVHCTIRSADHSCGWSDCEH